jgi:hypothetical protein
MPFAISYRSSRLARLWIQGFDVDIRSNIKDLHFLQKKHQGPPGEKVNLVSFTVKNLICNHVKTI